MTRSEAVANLRYMISEDCTDTQMDFEVEIKMAIDALELQIPKRAVGTHYAHMKCPSCGKRIPSGGGSSSHRRDNWCNYCGQKIDWEERKDDVDSR